MHKGRIVPILVLIVGAAIVGTLYSFNKGYHTYEQYLVTNVAALLWLPMMLIFIAVRQEPSGFGFQLGDVRFGYRAAGLMFLPLLILMVIAARMPDFQSYYPIQKQAANDLHYFAYFELTYGMYLFCWEFFFRGFLLFGLFRMFGVWSVFMQAVAFGIMHIGKPAPEIAASFGAGVILGFVALRCKSFVPGFALHWAAAVSFDVLIILGKRGMLF